MYKKNLSEVWKHFKKDKSCEKAKCKYCTARIGCKGSSTSGLIRHLSALHSEKCITLKGRQHPGARSSTSIISKIQPTILKYTMKYWIE